MDLNAQDVQDSNSDVQGDIGRNLLIKYCESLAITEMLDIADTCEYMRDIARHVFGLLGKERIIFCDFPEESDYFAECEGSAEYVYPIENPDTIDRDTDMRTKNPILFERIIRHFGDLLPVIDFRYSQLHTPQGSALFNLIIDICGETVEKLLIRGFYGGIPNSYILNEGAVKKYTFCPKVTELTLNCVYCNFDYMVFPELTTITVHGECINEIIKESLDKFFRRHFRIRDIHLDAIFICDNSAIGQLNLNKLDIHGFRDEVMSSPNFPHVKELGLYLSPICSVPNLIKFLARIPKTLEVLRLKVSVTKEETQLLEVIRKLKSLRKFWLHVYKRSFVQWHLLKALPALQELTLITFQHLYFADLNYILEEMPRLKIIQLHTKSLIIDRVEARNILQKCINKNVYLTITYEHTRPDNDPRYRFGKLVVHDVIFGNHSMDRSYKGKFCHLEFNRAKL